MKLKHALFLSAVVMVMACRNEPGKNSSVKTDSAEVALETNMDHEKTLVLPWTATVNDSTHKMEIRKDPAADMSHLNSYDIVDAINLKYPQIKLTWVKRQGNKIFVRIDDARYLTQQIGSEGAMAYLAEVTYALTELQGVGLVDIRFKTGDHAQPGIYHRQSFRGL